MKYSIAQYKTELIFKNKKKYKLANFFNVITYKI
jgi:hypothetical protein